MLSLCSRRCLSSSAAIAERIGFIGLGQMGAPMARNLVKKGADVVVFDLSAAAVDSLVSAGAKSAASPAAVAQLADTVITMLPSSPHVRSVLAGDGGVIAAAKAGSLLIDCSTIDPGTTREVAKIAGSKGLKMVDAPVSGGVGGATNGTLTFMVGGAPADFERAKPTLSKMGQNIVHCGDVGTGEVAKICNNLVLGVSMAAVSEAINLGVKLGIDPKVLSGVMNTSSGRCWSSDTYNPCPGVMPNVPASRGYSGGFATPLMLKDLTLATAAGAASHSPLPMAAAAQQLYETLCAHGHTGLDFSSVYKFLAASQGAK